ncbi:MULTISPECIES: hypothetical protein [unclassified Lacrimispora]|uniref:hypothetical protein n=1 Tax=unclassified Lacrimispora TaxID=2719232 RepID=UPI003770569C
MKETLENFRKNFINSNYDIADISSYGDIPHELMGEDVYTYTFLFKNEEIMINYVMNTYNLSREDILMQIKEEETLREEYGKENYLRSVQIKIDLFASELLDGSYILWQAY